MGRRGAVLPIVALGLVSSALPACEDASGSTACDPGSITKGSGALRPETSDFDEVEKTGTGVTARTGEFSVTVTEKPLSISAADRSGTFFAEGRERGLFLVKGADDARRRVYATSGEARELDGCGVRFDVGFDDGSGGELFVQPHAVDTVSVTVRPENPEGVLAWGETLRTDESERVYGLTERIVSDYDASEANPQPVGTLDRKGEAVEMYVLPTISAYVPFFHSTNGYGLLVDGTMPGTYDLGKSVPAELVFEFALDPQARAGRYFLFHGPDHYAINDAFTRLAGRPLLPPRHVFLHWRGRGELVGGPPVEVDGVPLNPTVADDLLNYDRFGIPAGVYHIDRPWGVGTDGYGDFRFDPARFPDAAAMLELLEERGWKSIVWISEWALDERKQEAQRNGWLAPGSDREIDLTNPEAVAWLQRDLRRFLRSPAGEHVDGFFLDRTEEIVPSTPSDVYHDGRIGPQIHNAYPVLMQRTVHEALVDERGDDGWIIARAAYTGSPRYVLTWGGDTRSQAGGVLVPERPDVGTSTDLGLRSVLVSVQRAAFMGLPYWGSDIGGYSTFADREVFARWIEVGAASPLMRFHGKDGDMPWAMPIEPTFDEEMIDIYRRYVRLHHMLADYLFDYAKEAHRTGAPIVRPLVFNYPNDRRVRDLWDQWLLGDDLLVAPVWQSGARSRTVYFPKGRWVDFWDRSRVIEGPVELTEDVPLGELPLFVKQGSKLLDIAAP